MLKLIQLGLTFTNAEGKLPLCGGELCVWQFNFRSAAWLYVPIWRHLHTVNQGLCAQHLRCAFSHLRAKHAILTQHTVSAEQP